jgi:LmbE family N-acetylglucosaminyl deacetylase
MSTQEQYDISALLSPPAIMDCKIALCIQPHPDDNEIGMGGIIAALAEKGCEIHYLTITNGDQGNLDMRASREDTAAVRRKEAIEAGKLLGAKEFHFFDHGDSTLSDVHCLSMEIAGLIREVCPEVVFCPDPWLSYEGHYDHVVTGLATANAFHLSGLKHFPGKHGNGSWRANAIGFYFTSRPNTVIDISSLFDKKMEAIALHRSQIDSETLAMYRFYFQMKGSQLAQEKGFALGEGLKALSQLHMHCFVDAEKI